MRKIMFNDRYGLTELVLKGVKTMTRRIESGIRIHGNPAKKIVESALEMHKSSNADRSKISIGEEVTIEICTRYRIGELVAVAQSYHCIFLSENLHPEVGSKVWEQIESKHPGSNNKMFVDAGLMPHRIRIKDIKIERLQDITDGDCVKEGIIKVLDSFYYFEDGENGCYFDTPREAFAALIDKTSGKGTWDSNPWVVVYEFEKEDCYGGKGKEELREGMDG